MNIHTDEVSVETAGFLTNLAPQAYFAPVPSTFVVTNIPACDSENGFETTLPYF
ncbi:hypothetical protein LTR46_011924, partial [Exophiala xenobiotica]